VNVERPRKFPNGLAVCNELTRQPGFIRAQFPWSAETNSTLSRGIATR
jgi:hypothetical protein